MSKRTDRKIQQAIGRVLLRIDASIKRQTAEQQRAADNAAEQLRQIVTAVDNIGYQLDELHSAIVASLPGEAPE